MKITARRKDELFRALRRSVPNLDEALRAELAKSGENFVAKASAFVPRDEGDLAASIKWQWTQNTIADQTRSPAIVIMAGDEAGGRADHARHVEFGTVDTTKQPFFFPAYRLERRKIKGRLTRAMTRALKKAGLIK